MKKTTYAISVFSVILVVFVQIVFLKKIIGNIPDLTTQNALLLFAYGKYLNYGLALIFVLSFLNVVLVERFYFKLNVRFLKIFIISLIFTISYAVLFTLFFWIFLIP